MNKLFFVGIAGSGMAPLALLCKFKFNYQVCGSDRSFDNNKNLSLKSIFEKSGIKIFPQNGSGIDTTIDALIVSTAVEPQIPDVIKAKRLHIPIFHRAYFLSKIVNPLFLIAIGGTSGKSTITGMIAHICEYALLDPTVINGGEILNFSTKSILPSIKIGKSNLTIIETDESDGSIKFFSPKIGAISNISLDHKKIEELITIFEKFAYNCEKNVVINADCPNSALLNFTNKFITFGTSKKANFVLNNFQPTSWGSKFNINSYPVELIIPGFHNAMNATCAFAIASLLNINVDKILNALSSFQGIKRRLQIIGKIDNVTIVDDFAHNPDKITASLKTIKNIANRVIAIYQPHGFGPTKFLKNELVSSFINSLSKKDILILLPIYYAGGTVKKDISSQDLIDEIKIHLTNSFAFTRNETIDFIGNIVKEGDWIIVMGARDNSLTDFSYQILKHIGTKKFKFKSS